MGGGGRTPGGRGERPRPKGLLLSRDHELRSQQPGGEGAGVCEEGVKGKSAGTFEKEYDVTDPSPGSHTHF